MRRGLHDERELAAPDGLDEAAEELDGEAGQIARIRDRVRLAERHVREPAEPAALEPAADVLGDAGRRRRADNPARVDALDVRGTDGGEPARGRVVERKRREGLHPFGGGIVAGLRRSWSL